MRKILFLTMLLPNFLLCLAAEGTGDTKIPRMCTGIGLFHTIKVTIISPHPLPPNLAVAFNGKKPNMDECGPENEFPESRVELNPERTKATLIFYLNHSPENYDFYLPKRFKKPASNLMSLTIYDRDKCTDPHSLFQEVSDAKISWKPVYINGGKHCGVDAYRGESKIDL